MPAYRQKAVESARVRGKTFEERLAELEGRSLEDHARSWLAEFDKAGVDTGAFIAVGEGNEELSRFVAINPKRFIGWGSLADPRHSEAARTVAQFRSLGLSGLKLYPPIQRFYPNDRALYPIYEVAAELAVDEVARFPLPSPCVIRGVIEKDRWRESAELIRDGAFKSLIRHARILLRAEGLRRLIVRSFLDLLRIRWNWLQGHYTD